MTQSEAQSDVVSIEQFMMMSGGSGPCSLFIDSSLTPRKDGTCVVQSGAWPHDALVYDDDGVFDSKAPYATCFVWYDNNNVATKYCWSRSYLTKGGDWKPCKPKGYGSDGWTELEQCDSEDDDSDDKSVVTNNCCGAPCTEFEKIER